MIESKRAQRLYEEVVASRKDCRFETVANLLEALSFTAKQPRRGGSHYTFRRTLSDGRKLRITVPRARPINSVYVDELISLIENTSLPAKTAPPKPPRHKR